MKTQSNPQIEPGESIASLRIAVHEMDEYACNAFNEIQAVASLVLAALETGRDLFTDWSATAEGFNASSTAGTWRSVKAGGGVRINPDGRHRGATGSTWCRGASAPGRQALRLGGGCGRAGHTARAYGLASGHGHMGG
jgi:hypothetical protein